MWIYTRKSVRNLIHIFSNGITVATPANSISGYNRHDRHGTQIRQPGIASRLGYRPARRLLALPKAIPDQTFNPAIPDGDNHVVSAGVGFMPGQRTVSRGDTLRRSKANSAPGDSASISLGHFV